MLYMNFLGSMGVVADSVSSFYTSSIAILSLFSPQK